jgi:hypothetical protein
MSNTSIIKGLAERIEREAPSVLDVTESVNNKTEREAFEAWFAPYWSGPQSDLAAWSGWQARAAAPQQAPQAAQPVQTSEQMDTDFAPLTCPEAFPQQEITRLKANLSVAVGTLEMGLQIGGQKVAPIARPLSDAKIKEIHWSKPMNEYEYARAIEATVSAPLLERIAELERQLRQGK